MPYRIVVNTCFGGFCLSKAAKDMYAELTAGVERSVGWCADLDVLRDDPRLLAVVDALGLEACSGRGAALAVVEIPDDVGADGRWEIQEYDGNEWVAETHRVWHAGISWPEGVKNQRSA